MPAVQAPRMPSLSRRRDESLRPGMPPRQLTLTRRRITPWQWPPVRSFTFANLLRLVLGLWVLNAPLLDEGLSPGELAAQNQLISGACTVLLAAMRIIFAREAGIFRWAHLFVGLWTLVSPWIFDYVDNSV